MHKVSCVAETIHYGISDKLQ